MTIGRFGELEGHMHGYDPALIMRGVAQTVADRRLTYLAMPDEAHATIADRWRPPDPGDRYEARCMVPWRDERRQFTYYCLLDAGHDDEAAVPFTDQPEHGWYKLLDAYERGKRANVPTPHSPGYVP